MDKSKTAGSKLKEGTILYIVHEYPPIVGGTGVMARNIIDEIRKERKVVVITSSEDPKGRRVEIENGELIKLRIPFRNKRFHYATPGSLFFFIFLAAWHGWRIGKDRPLAAIHAFHLFPSGLVAVVLARLLRVPSFVTAIGAEVYDPARRKDIHKKGYYKKMIAYVVRKSSRLSAISSDIAERVRGYCERDDIEILPPCISRSAGQTPRIEHDDFVICSISRLAPRKGLELTVKAIARLKGLPLRYIMIGDGSERDILIDLARSLEIEKKVDIRGFVGDDEKFRLLSESDLFVLPSHHEGFGICYIEAMSAGLPVIANSTGGQTDFIENGVNGILLDRLDEAELSEAIERFYRDPLLRERMGSANIEKSGSYLCSNLKEKYLVHYDSASDL
ncbi:MAG: glycosyltransferase family 4 protein [Candidatus Krumholzibacteriota bacterium]|nr:glycosyltransferase family 4 protein [Candidatus Krumholzibacteriota bacterium]